MSLDDRNGTTPYNIGPSDGDMYGYYIANEGCHSNNLSRRQAVVSWEDEELPKSNCIYVFYIVGR